MGRDLPNSEQMLCKKNRATLEHGRMAVLTIPFCCNHFFIPFFACFCYCLCPGCRSKTGSLAQTPWHKSETGNRAYVLCTVLRKDRLRLLPKSSSSKWLRNTHGRNSLGRKNKMQGKAKVSLKNVC